MTRRRVRTALLVGVVVAVGLASHTWLPESAAADIVGDALYAALVYLLVRFIAPRALPWVIGAVAAAWCAAVELLQLTGLPDRWGAVFPPAALVFGTVFDARDLVIYVIVVIVCAAVDAALRARSRSRSGVAPSPEG